MPPLTHGQKFAEDGVGGAMSPDGFDIAWTQYQGYTVSRLNQMLVGTVPYALNILPQTLKTLQEGRTKAAKQRTLLFSMRG